MVQVPYDYPSILRHRTKFSCPGYLAAGVFTPLQDTITASSSSFTTYSDYMHELPSCLDECHTVLEVYIPITDF